MNAMSPGAEGEVLIQTEGDIVLARRTVRELATAAGFGLTDVTRIVTASSELARNIFKYAGHGTMHWRWVAAENRQGLELRFADGGPGIPDIAQALQEGFSTTGGLGLGLPGVKRLMDEMEIQSLPGEGTTVLVKKWLKM
jgi:serine/threonine-protein kinase RsbT